MKVKIFSSVVSNDDLENQIAKWTKDLEPKIHDAKLNAISLHDYYGADHQTMAGMICNQWVEYTCVITYS